MLKKTSPAQKLILNKLLEMCFGQTHFRDASYHNLLLGAALAWILNLHKVYSYKVNLERLYQKGQKRKTENHIFII